MSVEIIRLEDNGDDDVAIVCDPHTAAIIAMIIGSVRGYGEIREVCNNVYYSLCGAGLDVSTAAHVCVNTSLLLNDNVKMPTEDDCPF